jgi:hypothetical protein
MLPRHRGDTSRERNRPGGITPTRPQHPRRVFFKGTTTSHNREDGVSTYLALTFGTLLSSQGTDASFGIPFGLSSGRFPSVFATLSGFFVFPDRRSANMQNHADEGNWLNKDRRPPAH